MAKRGRPPNLLRRQMALDLRQQGLTLQEIATRMGTSKQNVHGLLDFAVGMRSISCRLCGVVIVSAGHAMADMHNKPVCLQCLANMPHASFAERLRALRIARDLTQKQLAEKSGLTANTIHVLERELHRHPSEETIEKLAKILGPELLGLDAAE